MKGGEGERPNQTDSRIGSRPNVEGIDEIMIINDWINYLNLETSISSHLITRHLT